MSDRKNRQLNLAQKLEILNKLKAGYLRSKLARQYEVLEGTIAQIKRDEYVIRNARAENGSKNLFRPKLDFALLDWIDDQRAKGNAVSGAKLRLQAKMLNTAMNGPQSFKASNGWLYKFKERYQVSPQKMCEAELTENEPSPANYYEHRPPGEPPMENQNYNFPTVRPTVSSGEAAVCFEKGLAWLESRPESLVEDMVCLRRLLQEATFRAAFSNE